MSFPVINKYKQSLSGFRSYIDNIGCYEERAIDVPPEPDEKVEPFLLPREVIVAEAKNVLKFSTLRANEGISGTLFITNFKISFVTTSSLNDSKECEKHMESLQGDFLDLYDICLTEIDAVYHISEAAKRKKLIYGTVLPSRIWELHIVLKNCRCVNFNFQFSPLEDVSRIINGLLVHKFPNSVNLLHFSLNSPEPFTGIPEYRTADDWTCELKRTNCGHWRVTHHNEYSNNFPSLPSSFVIPHGLTDIHLERAANHFRGLRPPVWSWGTCSGASLIRMAQLSIDEPTKHYENEMMKYIHLSHPRKREPLIVDLDSDLPSLKAIQTAYIKLRNLHSPDSFSIFLESERLYLSKWEQSGWLDIITKCLEITEMAVTTIAVKRTTVVLQEGEGRDLSCVISSLIQVLLDSYSRTFRGFHSLIQKEWVALGHPFSTRLGRTRNNLDEQSPLWLLFLDCVHQIMRLHPYVFEFTEEYLMALWNGSHCSIFSSTMFNCIKDRNSALQDFRQENRKGEPYLWSLWSWWGYSECQRTLLQRKELKKRKEILSHKRQFESERRLSLIKSVNFDGSKDDSELLYNRDLKVEEEKILEIEKLCKEDSVFRKKNRERFVNVYYIELLLETFLARDTLNRVGDPMANSHLAWQRLRHLLGKSESPLPYDPSQPPPQLEVVKALSLSGGYKMQPWINCFGSWLPDSDYVRGETMSPVLKPSINNLQSHWTCVRDIVNFLDINIPSSW